MSHRYLVLGLLSEMPRTGYEIKKHVGTTLKAVTSASYGTLYPTLHRLLKEGAVHMEEHPQTHRPARKVYEITERGLHELDEWLHQPTAADHIRREFLLKLYLSHDLPSADLKHLLEERRAVTQAQLEELVQHRDNLNGSTSPIHTWVQDYTIEMCQAELTWLAQRLDELEAQAPPHEPFTGEQSHTKVG